MGGGICSDGVNGDGTCHCNVFYSLTPNDDCTYPASGYSFFSLLSLLLMGFVGLVRYRKRNELIMSALTQKENELLKASIELRKEKIESQKAQEGWRIQESEITLGKKVGSGSYGDVYSGKWSPLKDVPVAIKVIASEGKLAPLDDAEMLLMQRIRHPRLVLFFGTGLLKSRNCAFMVTEFLAGGDLMEFIEKAVASNYEKNFPLVMRMRSAMDIAEGMEYLHSQGWVHRDLKSANILRDEMGRCKITDFGLSKSVSSKGGKSSVVSKSSLASKSSTLSRSTKSIKSFSSSRSMASTSSNTSMEMTAFSGSGPWLAPELITKTMDEVAVGGQEVDVYSFGCVLYEIIEGRIPWANAANLEDIFSAVEVGERPKLTLKPPVGPEQSSSYAALCDLMAQCWQHEALRRPSFTEVTERLQYAFKNHTQIRKDRKSERRSFFGGRTSASRDSDTYPSDIGKRGSFHNPVVQMTLRNAKRPQK